MQTLLYKKKFQEQVCNFSCNIPTIFRNRKNWKLDILKIKKREAFVLPIEIILFDMNMMGVINDKDSNPTEIYKIDLKTFDQKFLIDFKETTLTFQILILHIDEKQYLCMLINAGIRAFTRFDNSVIRVSIPSLSIACQVGLGFLKLNKMCTYILENQDKTTNYYGIFFPEYK